MYAKMRNIRLIVRAEIFYRNGNNEKPCFEAKIYRKLHFALTIAMTSTIVSKEFIFTSRNEANGS